MDEHGTVFGTNNGDVYASTHVLLLPTYFQVNDAHGNLSLTVYAMQVLDKGTFIRLKDDSSLPDGRWVFAGVQICVNKRTEIPLMWNVNEPNELPRPFMCKNRKCNMAQFLSYSWATMEGDDSRLDEKIESKDMLKLDAAIDAYFDDNAVSVSAKTAPVLRPRRTTTKPSVTPKLFTQAELDAHTSQALKSVSPTSSGSGMA